MAMEKYNVVKAYAWSGQLGKRWSQELDKEHMLFEEAASRGHLTSIDQLGRIYLDGRGVVPALRWPSAGSRMRRTRGSSLPGPHRRSILGEGVERSDGIAWGWLLNRYAQRLIGDMVSGAVATMDLCLWRLLTTGTRWRRPGTMARLESNARIGIMPQDGVGTLPKDEVRALDGSIGPFNSATSRRRSSKGTSATGCRWSGCRGRTGSG